MLGEIYYVWKILYCDRGNFSSTYSLLFTTKHWFNQIAAPIIKNKELNKCLKKKCFVEGIRNLSELFKIITKRIKINEAGDSTDMLSLINADND